MLARCEPDGSLRVEGGRVEIRYRPSDARAYRASVANLHPSGDASILPDAHCVALDDAKADAPAPRAAPSARRARKPARAEAAAASPAPPSTAGEQVLVYADGACSGNPGPAGLGVVIYADGTARELSEYLGPATNNVAELTAILRAAEALVDEPRPVVLKTDSQYAIGVLTKGWKAKANPELIRTTKAALAKLPALSIRYVEGHAGHAGNERADALARAAVSARASSGWRAIGPARGARSERSEPAS